MKERERGGCVGREGKRRMLEGGKTLYAEYE